MAIGKMRHDWDQTSLVWSVMANSMRDPKKQRKPFSPALVHPYRDAKEYEAPPIQADINVLRMLLPNGHRERNPSR
jgi:hypothetical protein